MTEFQKFLIASGAKILVVLIVLLTSLAYTVWLERKLAGRIQNRWGPTRTGPHGLLQPLADLIKFIFKEDPTPAQAQLGVYYLAPFLSLVCALMSITVIPFGGQIQVAGVKTFLQISDLSVGILFILGMTSLGVYGISLAGWSSGSKYALLGGLRSSAQMISYELSLSFSVVVPLLMAGSLSLREIVNTQAAYRLGVIPHWNALTPWGFVAFITYLISAFAETNRVPFDLPEAEGELVAGFHTEYSSVKFAMFFTAEYGNMVTVCCLATLLFLGGWQAPLPFHFMNYTPVVIFLAMALMLLKFSFSRERLVERLILPVFAGVCIVLALLFLWTPFQEAAIGVFWFISKVLFFIFLYIWVRWTLPRFRYDTLMEFGWKRMVPITIVNLLVAGLVIAWRASAQ